MSRIARRRIRTPVFLLVALLALSCLCAGSPQAGVSAAQSNSATDDGGSQPEVFKDFVWVRAGQQELTLATLADPSRRRVFFMRVGRNPVRFRYRRVRLPAAGDTAFVGLSRGGTKVALTRNGVPIFVDLTRGVTAEDFSQSRAPQHYLKDDVFLFRQPRGRSIRPLDDRGQLQLRFLRDLGATDAALHEAGPILYRSRDNQLLVHGKNSGPGGAVSERTQCVLSTADDYELVPAPLDANQITRHHFIVIRKHADGLIRLYLPSDCVNPVSRVGNETFDDWTSARFGALLALHYLNSLATLDARLESTNPLIVQVAKNERSQVEDEIRRLPTLVPDLISHLKNQEDPAPRQSISEWKVYHLRPERNLYVPVLQFASEERVFPASVDVWRSLADVELKDVPVEDLVEGAYTTERPSSSRPDVLRVTKLNRPRRKRDPFELTLESLSTGAEHGRTYRNGESLPVLHATDALGYPDRDIDKVHFRRYRDLGADAARSLCTLQSGKESYRGSWVLKLWIYYPFDEGVNPHQHDPEHLFIEVDKLGGSVRGVYGSAHTALSPNNIFQNTESRASVVSNSPVREIPIPLHVIVELGKHASAPDINADGVFTPGLDENYYVEAAKLWGVRDAFGETDSFWRPYGSDMAAPRQERFRLYPSDFSVSFPEAHSAVSFNGSQAVCSLVSFDRTRLAPPTDSSPDELFKWALIEEAKRRVSDHADSVRSHQIFKPETFSRAAARVGFESRANITPVLGFGVELASVARSLPLPGRLVTQGSLTGNALDIRYERFLSNVLGYQVGVSWEFGELAELNAPDEPAATELSEEDSEPVVNHTVFTAGIFFEFPVQRIDGTLNVHVGHRWRRDFSTLGWRWGFTYAHYWKRENFGIPADERSPYQ